MEKVTLRDVAAAAGVSIATASWAVNDNRDVRITTHNHPHSLATNMYTEIHEGRHRLSELGCDSCYN